MRNVCCNILSAADSLTTNGSQIDANQLVSASFQSYFGDTSAAGTFKIQASNDPTGPQTSRQNFVATHWTDIPDATATITSGASAIITIANMAYSWVRAVYTSTATGAQTITTIADTAGSLNSKYFLLDSANASTKYYVWMNVNSAGVDPMIAGRTGVEIALATAATANDVADGVAAGIDALALFVAPNPAANIITVTNSASGPFIAAVDVNTGFTFAITVGGSTTVNVDMNALGI